MFPAGVGPTPGTLAVFQLQRGLWPSLTYNTAHALCATGNHGEAEALAEENLVLQKRVYGAAHPNAAAALELVGHVRAGLAARA